MTFLLFHFFLESLDWGKSVIAIDIDNELSLSYRNVKQKWVNTLSFSRSLCIDNVPIKERCMDHKLRAGLIKTMHAGYGMAT